MSSSKRNIILIFLAIIIFALLLFSPKIIGLFEPCTKHVEYQGEVVIVKGLKAKLGKKIDDIELGEIKINKEKYRDASDRLQQLDMLQYSICKQLRNMEESKQRTELEKKYIELLMKILKTATHPETAIEEKKISILLFKDRVHLGDNVFSREGGMVFPSQDKPTIDKNEEVVYYNKENKVFYTYFGTTTGVQFIESAFREHYEKLNLEAYKHIFAGSVTEVEKETYKGSSVQIDPKTLLIWKQGMGNFYDKIAAIARTKSINIFKEFMIQNIDPRNKVITRAFVRMEGFHGGRRSGQLDNIDLLINDQRYPIEFKYDAPRNEEFIEIELKNIQNLNIKNPGRNTIISIVVLPYQEEYPLPPPDSEFVKMGPAHFRDVEIGNVNLLIEYMNGK
ncbi:hypothetical protein ACFL9T_21670 [Thermodesulfobacteriota bacterium]